MIAKSKTVRTLPGTLVAAFLMLGLATAPAQDRETRPERDKAEARESDREHERDKPETRDGEKRDEDEGKPEAREGDRPHAAVAEAHEREIRAVREEIGRLAREGKKEEAERLELQLKKKLERLRDQPKARPGADQPKEGDVESLRKEIGRLSREGKHDQAEALEKRLRARLEGRAADHRPSGEAHPGGPEDLRRQLTELTEMVRHLQHSVNEMREELHQLRPAKHGEE